MACFITSGISRDCDFSQGGLVRVWLANESDVSSIVDSGADNILDTITMVGGGKFYLFEPEDNTATFAASLQKGSQTFYNHTLQFITPEKSGVNNVVVEKIALGRFIAIVEDANSKFWVVGMSYQAAAGVGKGLTAVTDGANAASGAQAADSAGYTISLAGGVNGLPAQFSGVDDIPVSNS